jgi:hypothetical protein
VPTEKFVCSGLLKVLKAVLCEKPADVGLPGNRRIDTAAGCLWLRKFGPIDIVLEQGRRLVHTFAMDPPDGALPKRDAVRVQPLLRDFFERQLLKVKPLVIRSADNDAYLPIITKFWLQRPRVPRRRLLTGGWFETSQRSQSFQ